MRVFSLLGQSVLYTVIWSLVYHFFWTHGRHGLFDAYNQSSVTVEPTFVKKYMKALANTGFCKKKLDTRFDTHCIKTGVQLWRITEVMIQLHPLKVKGCNQINYML